MQIRLQNGLFLVCNVALAVLSNREERDRHSFQSVAQYFTPQNLIIRFIFHIERQIRLHLRICVRNSMSKPNFVLIVLQSVIKRQCVIVIISFTVPILVLHVPITLSLVCHCPFDTLDWVLTLLVDIIWRIVHVLEATLQIETGYLIRLVCYVFAATLPPLVELTWVTIKFLVGETSLKLLSTKDNRLHSLFVQTIGFTQV